MSQFPLGGENHDGLWVDGPKSIRVSYTVEGPVRLLAGDEQPLTAAEADHLLVAANDAIGAWNRRHGEGQL